MKRGKYKFLAFLISLFLCLSLVLPAWGAEASVSGNTVVISGNDASPLSGVSLVVEKADGSKKAYIGQTLSDASGSYSFRIILPAGSYRAYLGGGTTTVIASITVTDSPSSPGGGSGQEVENRAYLSITDDNGRTVISGDFPLMDGDTVLSFLRRAAMATGISLEVEGGYVKSINGLAHKKPGYPRSGWKYRVNGVYPLISAADYVLRKGDRVEWVYTLDYTRDPDATGFEKPKDAILVLPVKEELKNRYEEKIREIGDKNLVLNLDKRMDAKKAEEIKKELEANLVEAEGRLDEKGGVLGDKEAVLIVPADAVNRSLRFTIREIRKDAYPEAKGYRLASGVYDFGPEGIKFLKPVTIMIKMPVFPEDRLDKLVSAFYDEKEKTWKTLPGLIDAEEGVAFFRTEHFTKFAVVEKMEEAKSEEKKEAVCQFADVDKNLAWAEEAIYSLAASGIIKGTGENRFEPYRSITRAELASMLVRAGGIAAGEEKAAFTDVKKGDWFYRDVNAAYANNMVKGYPDGTFKPGKEVSRKEAAVMLAGLYTKGLKQKERAVFRDEKAIPLWARDKVYLLQESGIMSGYPDGTFKGDKSLSRAEAAVIIYRILKPAS